MLARENREKFQKVLFVVHVHRFSVVTKQNTELDLDIKEFVTATVFS